MVTRRDIIRAISEELDLTKVQTSHIIHDPFDAIVNTLVEEGRVELRNFGVSRCDGGKPPGSQPAYRGKRHGARTMPRHLQAWAGVGGTGASE